VAAIGGAGRDIKSPLEPNAYNYVVFQVSVFSLYSQTLFHMIGQSRPTRLSTKRMWHTPALLGCNNNFSHADHNWQRWQIVFFAYQLPRNDHK
jgi:hypothetical protein